MKTSRKKIASLRKTAVLSNRFAETIAQKHRPGTPYAPWTRLTHKEEDSGLDLYLERLTQLLSQRRQSAPAPAIRQTIYQDLRRYCQTTVNLPSGAAGSDLQEALRALLQAPSQLDAATVEQSLSRAAETLARLQAEKKTADAPSRIRRFFAPQPFPAARNIPQKHGGLSRPVRLAEREPRAEAMERPPFFLVALPQSPDGKKTLWRGSRGHADALPERDVARALIPADMQITQKRLPSYEAGKRPSARRPQPRIFSLFLPAPAWQTSRSPAIEARAAWRRGFSGAESAGYREARRLTPAEGFFYFGSKYTLLPHMSLSLPVENAAVYRIPPEHPLFSSIQRHADPSVRYDSAASFLHNFIRRAVRPVSAASKYGRIYWQRIVAKLEPILKQNWPASKHGNAAQNTRLALQKRQETQLPNLLFLLTDWLKHPDRAALRHPGMLLAQKRWLNEAALPAWAFPFSRPRAFRQIRPAAGSSVLASADAPYLILLAPHVSQRLSNADPIETDRAQPHSFSAPRAIAFGAAAGARRSRSLAASPLVPARKERTAALSVQKRRPALRVRPAEAAEASAAKAPPLKTALVFAPPADAENRGIHLQRPQESKKQLQDWIAKAAAKCADETEARLKAALFKADASTARRAPSIAEKKPPLPIAPPPSADPDALYAKLYERLERELRSERRRAGL